MQKMGMQILWSVLYGIFGGLIFLLGLNFLKSIPEKFQDIYKIGLPIPFLIMYFLSQRYLPNQKNVFWAFFLVSMGWMLDFYLTGRFKDLFSLNAKELSGFAYTMVISTLLVSLPVISGWLISNQELSTIYLQWSEGNWGIIVGLIGFLLLGGFGVLQALGQGLETKVIGAAIPMMLVFSLANGFSAAVFVTTLVFTLAHIDVSYTPANLIIFTIALVMIGVIGSLIMIKTGSLIGAVLFHAGADVALIIDLLSSHQLILK